MTGLKLGVWCIIAVILLCTPARVDARNVTHEDIRDAMLSLVHMYRTSEDKLERHEYREKALGEQLKKMLAGLDKKHRTLEPLKGMLSRLDERLSNVETILMQKEEREKVMQQKTNDALETIQKTLLGLKSGGDNKSDSKIDSIKKDVEILKNTLSKESLRAMCLEVSSDDNPFEKHISEAEKLLNKYELKLSEYNGTAGRVQTDFVPLNEITLADDAWHSKMTEVMERQEKEIKKIQRLLSDAEGLWKDLAKTSDVNLGVNHTLMAIEHVKVNASAHDEGIAQLQQKLRDMNERLLSTNEDIQRSLTEGNTMTERLLVDIYSGYNALRTEVKTLSGNENILLQTADNVISNKKLIEYSVHQILNEVGKLVSNQGKNLNKTIGDRFDSIQTTIVDNQTGALTNLSSKIESEMAQVWRQIGIMYQQLSASKISLDKLTEQTEQYVNGSGTTMDNMKNKIGLITTRMEEVDQSLNYLLGRLSVVATEFSRMKTGLGDALEKVQTSFKSVQKKIDDAGPGPHNINSAERESNQI